MGEFELEQRLKTTPPFSSSSSSKRKAASGEAKVDRGEPRETETGDDQNEIEARAVLPRLPDGGGP